MDLLKGYYGSPRWSHEIIDCSMPLTLDTYSNCSFKCQYCFSYFQRALGNPSDDYLHNRVKAVDVENVKQVFLGKGDPQFTWYVNARHPIQWGGLSDGFDYFEKRFGKSLELLTFFNEIDYPVSISTKGTWFLDDPRYVAQIAGRKNLHFKISIITTNEDHVKKIEPGVSSAADRLEALRRLHEMGVAVTLRFRPFILGTSDLTMDDLIQRAAAAGIPGVTSEFLCLEGRSVNVAAERYDTISRAVGYDIFEFYRKNSRPPSGLMRLNYEVKRPHFERLETLTQQYGMKLWISDSHHKEKCHNAGCCGLPDEGPLSNYCTGTFTEALLIAKRNGVVSWSDIEPMVAEMKNLPYKRADYFNKGNTRNRAKGMYWSMYDYIKYYWNRPTSTQSPAKYFGGVLLIGGIDPDGNLIYRYNRALVEEGPAAARKAMNGGD